MSGRPSRSRRRCVTCRPATRRGILSVELVTGPFDVICLVEAEDLAELGTQITDGIQSVAGVKRTTTCLTIQVS